MGIRTLQTLFIILLTSSSTIQSACQASSCGNISIHPPFKLRDMPPQDDDCPYIDLRCTSEHRILLHLPRAGEFYLRNINYDNNFIQLYDPGNCIMARMMRDNLDLSSSPFKAISYQRFYFYTCPPIIRLPLTSAFKIDCLSNYTSSMVASPDIPPMYMPKGCDMIGSWILPVLVPNRFLLDSDLYLTWNSSRCPDHCQDKEFNTPIFVDGRCSLWTKFCRSPLFVLSIVSVAIVFLVCILTVVRVMVCPDSIHVSDSTTPPAQLEPVWAAPASATGGVDESRINWCTELVIFVGSRKDQVGPDSDSCSICLESYDGQELGTRIVKCEHRFHANCLQQWLRQNRTCPVCRTILS